MIAMAGLGVRWNSIQTWLFPTLEDELGELNENHRLFQQAPKSMLKAVYLHCTALIHFTPNTSAIA